MWHNMISQFNRLFLELWFTSHQKNDLNSYHLKNVALYVKVLFKNIHINVWQIKISRPLTSPLHNEKFGVNFLQDSNNAFILNPSKGYSKGGL